MHTILIVLIVVNVSISELEQDILSMYICKSRGNKIIFFVENNVFMCWQIKEELWNIGKYAHNNYPIEYSSYKKEHVNNISGNYIKFNSMNRTLLTLNISHIIFCFS
jgi:hypothetical protein